MTQTPAVSVVRLGHRPGRDERTTTHVALVARAFGADEAVLPAAASHVVETVDDIAARFGGEFAISTVDSPMGWLRRHDGPIVHLTMYGLPVQDLVDEINADTSDGRLAVAVGAGKVPGELYELADWNVAVTNQPHSEIAALGVFFDRFTQGDALEREWSDGPYQIHPSPDGKRVEPTEDR